MSKYEFLDKLPDRVIKNGRIVEVKNVVEKKLGMDNKGFDLKYFDKFVLNPSTPTQQSVDET
jgi:hypothetical protein